jgi:hypothetical protein
MATDIEEGIIEQITRFRRSRAARPFGADVVSQAGS